MIKPTRSQQRRFRSRGLTLTASINKAALAARPKPTSKPTSASGSKPFFQRKKNAPPRTRPTRAGEYGDGGDGHLEAHAGGVRRRGRGGREGEERRRGRGATAVLPAAHPRPAAPDPAEDPQPQPPRGPAQRPQLPR